MQRLQQQRRDTYSNTPDARRQRCVTAVLSFGVAIPTQFLCVWSPFLLLLFLTLRLDEASVC